MKRSKKAALLSTLFMGLGQFYNKEIYKGIIFSLIEVLVIVFFIPYFGYSMWGLFTLGETPQYFVDGIAYGHHSIFLLIDGIISILTLVIIGIVYYLNIVDAKKTAKRLEEGKPLLTPKEYIKYIWERHFHKFMLTPSFVFIMFFTLLPIIFTICIAFTNYSSPNHLPPRNLVDWVGLKNFKNLLSLKIWNNTFIGVGLWTVIWALLATATNYFVGLFLALLVNAKGIKIKKFWRSMFILPYAIPAFISLLVMRLAFSGPGPVNNLLVTMGFDKSPWLTDPFLAKVMIVVINIWLGSPYWMALMSGVLTNISKDMYEAAEIDGASKVQQFFKITLPMVLFQTAPLLIMTFAYNFNNFNVIYLLTDGNPVNSNYRYAGSTDILISWIYKLTRDNNQYHMASAVTLIIFIFIASISAYSFTKTKSFKEEDMM
ncbi:sugar ABC transporter permease [Caldisalinibacter kiritimatiensis]|uniref:Maltose/maltodextrin transport system permease protein n=1 Tax=Caldisalinibacter kiritimatiensis TaxID=1304284 RepID=R1CVW7_9FIRM|nr:sugar ABC transporter permease [Caldisalinibacter kiritimatiensis]EOD00784.1 Maltose/maltodextrin ABC transporter, permease protein MalF [Caldisalinibacter kiritimatiensis]